MDDEKLAYMTRLDDAVREALKKEGYDHPKFVLAVYDDEGVATVGWGTEVGMELIANLYRNIIEAAMMSECGTMN